MKTLVLVLLVCGLLSLGSTFVHAQVTLDVKPDGLGNPINVKSHGKTPIAILCTPTMLDVSVIAVDSLSLLADTSTLAEGADAVKCALEDVNDDGCVDLVCKFQTDELDVTCASTALVLTGAFLDGTTFTAKDTIKPVPCK